ncbi:ester cyclase [Dyadobacter arcticus]|uniref:Nuclear transport factor 2 family protein n=1 Tax=Dyadobacter arcticus TaxID=1078754 RepID=A0ABX0UH77_9BACT|nr:ester cyclase [Dyadobacter arcticus]NIJ52366.1 hypothetical protein [Dyadobacter arcticus]
MKRFVRLFSIFVFALGQLIHDTKANPFSGWHPKAELANTGSIDQNPRLTRKDTANTWIVRAYLEELIHGDFKAARDKLANDFKAYGPGFSDFLGTDDLLEQWRRNFLLFTDQKLIYENTRLAKPDKGQNRGQWVYLKAVWSAKDQRDQGKPIQIVFHQLALIVDNKIQQTYTSYGNDQLFFDLGFAIYGEKNQPLKIRDEP